MVQLWAISRKFIRQEISCRMVRSEKKRLWNAAREEPQPTDSFEVKYIILHSPKTKIKSQRQMAIYMVTILLLDEKDEEVFKPHMRITQRMLRDIHFQQDWLCK